MRITLVVAIILTTALMLTACVGATSPDSSSDSSPAAVSTTTSPSPEQVVAAYIAAFKADDSAAAQVLVAPGFQLRIDDPGPPDDRQFLISSPQQLNLESAELFRSTHTTAQMEQLLDPDAENVMVSVTWEGNGTPGSGLNFIGLVRLGPDAPWQIIDIWGAPLYQ